MKNGNKAFELFFDGGICVHPDGGYSCYYGWVILQNGKVKLTGNGYEHKQDNVGSCGVELEAAARGMRDAIKLGAEQLEVFGDSLTVIECINGLSVRHSDIMSQGCENLLGMATRFKQVVFQWIPREKNALADRAGRMAYKNDHETLRRYSLIRQANDLYRHLFKNTLTVEVRKQWHLSLTGKASLTQMTAQEIKRVMAATEEFVAGVMQNAA